MVKSVFTLWYFGSMCFIEIFLNRFNQQLFHLDFCVYFKNSFSLKKCLVDICKLWCFEMQSPWESRSSRSIMHYLYATVGIIFCLAYSGEGQKDHKFGDDSFQVFLALSYFPYQHGLMFFVQGSVFKDGRGDLRIASIWSWYKRGVNTRCSVKLLWHCFESSNSWRPPLKSFAGCRLSLYMLSFRDGCLVLMLLCSDC